MPYSDDRLHLDHAARLALRGAGRVEANPVVGAVIVKNRQVLGQGHHQRFGAPHAEREGLADCLRRGHDPAGATLYTTLEPCSHHGKTPPCTDAIIQAGVARVIAATPDPNPRARGGGEILREAGVDFAFSDASALALAINAPFIKRITTGLPWVTAKWAQTIDGRIATRTGESKWISGPAARRRVHRLRARVDAILTGLGTVRADDPLLTARDGPPPRRIATRIILDPQLETPETAQLIRTAGEIPTLLACSESAPPARIDALQAQGAEILRLPPGPGGLDLQLLLHQLAEHHRVSNILVECGPNLLGSLFEADLIDEALIYIAPMLLGDDQAMPAATGLVAESLHHARRFKLCRTRQLGPDVELLYRRLLT